MRTKVEFGGCAYGIHLKNIDRFEICKNVKFSDRTVTVLPSIRRFVDSLICPFVDWSIGRLVVGLSQKLNTAVPQDIHFNLKFMFSTHSYL
jgi:hypothetical protein